MRSFYHATEFNTLGAQEDTLVHFNPRRRESSDSMLDLASHLRGNDNLQSLEGTLALKRKPADDQALIEDTFSSNLLKIQSKTYS